MEIVSMKLLLLKNIPFLRRFIFNYFIKWSKKNVNAEPIVWIINNIRMKLFIKDWVQYNLFVYGFYEKNETRYWLKTTRNAKVIVDVGANVGYYSLIASENIKKNAGAIYAFEPISKTYARLIENITLNYIDCVKHYKKAISDKTEKISLNVGNDKNWGMSSINNHEHLSGEVEIVECETLDSFCQAENISKIDLIKIDVEGAEYSVLKGMKNVLETHHPEILIEIFDKHLNKQNVHSEDIFNFLWEKGYKSYQIVENGKIVPLTKAGSYEGLICFKYAIS